MYNTCTKIPDGESKVMYKNDTGPIKIIHSHVLSEDLI